MTSLLFDTYKAVKDLQEAGFDEAQAEAVVATVGTAIIGNVATKQDVIDARNASKSDIQALGSDLRSEIQDIRANGATKQDISNLRSEMQAMDLRITLRMGGLIAVGVALIIALDKLL